LPRTIEILFRTRRVPATRTLFRRLQTFGNIIETALDRAFIGARATSLLSLSLLLFLTLLITVERLLTFANPIRHSIARERIRRVFQLTRRALLTLALARAHRARRLFEILLQTVHCISQRVLSFRQLFASLARVFILRVLTAATRKTLHVFRNLALPRRRLRRPLSQISDLLLPPG